MKHRCKVNNQIRRDCVESHPLAHLTPYQKTDINSRQISAHCEHAHWQDYYFVSTSTPRGTQDQFIASKGNVLERERERERGPP